MKDKEMEAAIAICACGHYQDAHRDKGYDADRARSVPGLGSCTEEGCHCAALTKKPSKFRDAIKELDKSIEPGIVICRDETEAAREAAWQNHIQYRRPHKMPSADEIFEYKKGFVAGYNARQPKPCVWTRGPNMTDGTNQYTTSCRRCANVTMLENFCLYCGGKIEESAND